MLDSLSENKKQLYCDQPSSSTWVKENFVIGEVLGSGTFGTVYSVECRRKPGTIYAMKELTRNSLPRYVATELRILQRCGGQHNVMRMHAAHRDKDRIFIVMDYFEHTPIKEILPTITVKEISEYMKNLLVALQYLHAKGIIHRDVKPSNFLFDRKRNRFSLIDFGLCQEVGKCSSLGKRPRRTNGAYRCSSKRICLEASMPGKEKNSETGEPCVSGSYRNGDKNRFELPGRCKCLGQPLVCPACLKRPNHNVNKAGTPGFRAPEVLLKSNTQTSLMDIWAAGITFLSLMCRRHPVLRPADDHEAIAQIMTVFGTAPLQELAERINASFVANPTFPGLDIVKFVNAVRYGIRKTTERLRCEPCQSLFYGNEFGVCLCKPSEGSSLRELAPDERQLFEIMRKCLIVDPDRRYTAQMLSTFFS